MHSLTSLIVKRLKPRLFSQRNVLRSRTRKLSSHNEGEARYAEVFGTLKIRPNDLEDEHERASLHKAILYLPLGNGTSQGATRIELPLSSTVADFREAVGKASENRVPPNEVSVQSLLGVKFADMTRMSQIVFNEFNVYAGQLSMSVTAADADAYDARSLIGNNESLSKFGLDARSG